MKACECVAESNDVGAMKIGRTNELDLGENKFSVAFARVTSLSSHAALRALLSAMSESC